MKKLNLAAILFMVFAVLAGCDKDEPNKDDPNNGLGKILEKYLNVEDGKVKMLDVSKVPGATGTAKDLDLTPTSVYPMLLVGKGFEGVTAVGWVYGTTKAPVLGEDGVEMFDAFVKFPALKYENTKDKQKNMALGLSGLQPNTTYYIRGFVKHGDKVSYSYNELKITTPKKDKTGGSYSFSKTTGPNEQDIPNPEPNPNPNPEPNPNPNPDITGDFILKGTIATQKNIDKNNVVEVMMGDFGDENKDDFLTAKGKIVNKKFAIPISNVENQLKFITINEIKATWKGNITKIECKKSKIKTGLIAGIMIKNSGTNIVNLEPAILSTKKSETLVRGNETIWNIPHMMGYMYCSTNFVFHKDFEKPEDLKPGKTPTKFALNLKKGWNLVKVDHIYDAKGEHAIFTSVSKIPSDYKWRLVSDLFPEKFDGIGGVEKQIQLKNLFLK